MSDAGEAAAMYAKKCGELENKLKEAEKEIVRLKKLGDKYVKDMNSVMDDYKELTSAIIEEQQATINTLCDALDDAAALIVEGEFVYVSKETIAKEFRDLAKQHKGK